MEIKGGRVLSVAKVTMQKLLVLWVFAGFVLAAGVVLIGVGTAFLVTSTQPSEPVCSLAGNTFQVKFEPTFLRMTYSSNSDHRAVLSVLMGQTPIGDGPFASYPRTVEVCDDEEACAVVSYEIDGNKTPLKMTVKELPASSSHEVTCFETLWTSESDDVAPTDCFPMADHWFGGAEMYYQDWPVNTWNKNMSFYLSGDMFSDPQQFGSVLERYWLSSGGVALYVPPEVPLHVSIEKGQICFKGAYEGPYTIRNNPYSTHWLSYTACMGRNPQSVQHYMFDSYFKRPNMLPSNLMMKSPIWSTWARYKIDINESVIFEYANEILKHEFSNSQIEIDDGYEANYGDHTFDPSKFPNATAMISTLSDLGFRVTTWVTPFINPRSFNYDHADTNKLFVQNGKKKESGKVAWWNGIGSSLDFTKWEACEWYAKALSDVKAKYGVTSFKFDAGEINYVTAVPNFETHLPVENLGSYTQSYAECAAKLGIDIEIRAAWNCQHLPAFVRMMDKDSNWGPAKGLQTLIPTALTFSLLGYPYILPDMIGGNAYEEGLHGKPLPERELFIRWLELTAFLPAMQFSYSPWQYDDETIEIAKRYVELHETVVLEELVRASTDYITRTAGMGPIRPIWWVTDGDSRAFTIDDEFMLGDRYLVAPIIEKGARSRDIYLPGPSWRNGSGSIVWKDQLGKHPPVLGGTVVQNYRIEIDEISWWELTLS